ncbi:MAG: metal-dependent hydrolase [Anaerolineales bacterium]|jgi:L-ascorbate metabolism protein UlaG (beta-lactamase superfamily)
MTTKYTFLGHGVHLIETNGTKLLVDPFFTNNPAAAISADEAEADYIFVSHGHGDHVGDTVEISKRTGALVIANAEICGWLGKRGVKVHAQHIGGGYHHPFGYLKFTIAFHGSGMPDGSSGGNPAGMLLTTKDDQKIYIACDTGMFGGMHYIGDEGLDLAVIPIGDNFTMGPDDALIAVNLLRPKHVIPCHYNTWPVIEQDPHAWAKRVAEETDATPHVLEPGESFSL